VGTLRFPLTTRLVINDGTLRPAEARLEYINAHSVFFFAIGTAGRELKMRDKIDLVGKLESIDWRRTYKEWRGICMLDPI
jgi:DNA-sulfur modification-associated